MTTANVTSRSILWASLTVIILRLVTLSYPDLVDTTEGRYAGVAQLMLQRDDWVTPWINLRGVDKPYLGKPPLHFWLMQISFIIFGENTFAARLPSVVSAIGIGVALWITAQALLGIEAAIVAVMVLGSSCMLFFLGGAVVLDVTLTLGITIALLAFLMTERSRLAGYLVFAGLGLGVLVKGPLACVLAGCTIAPWALLYRYTRGSWPSQFRMLPWISGSLLFLAIVLPWYLWAEVRNPGFLKYFLWNENFGRYLKTEYGDEYGSGHRQPFGACWGMMILGTVPWSLAFVALLVMKARSLFSKKVAVTAVSDSLFLYALCWTLSCPVLLLGARQYTATYLMPSIPGFAFLMAICFDRARSQRWMSESVISQTLRIIGILLGLATVVGALISLKYGAPLLLSLSTLAVAVLLLMLFVRAANTSILARTVQVSLLTVFVYAAASICFDNHLSGNRSTRRALGVIRSIVPVGQSVTVGLPFYVPFSAFFYTRAVQDSTIKLLPLDEDSVATTPVDLMLVRERNMSRLRQARPNIEEVARLNQWRIVRDSGAATSGAAVTGATANGATVSP